MTTRSPFALCLLLGALLLTWSSTGLAQGDLDANREQARPIALEGFELFQAKKFNEAIAKLEEAERIFHAPTHLLLIGKARRELGEKLTAYNTFIDILIEDIPNYAPEQFQKAKADAQVEADSLRAEIATVSITVTGAEMAQVTVRIDDRPIPSKRLAHPVAVTSGSHTVTAAADNAEAVSQTIEAVDGESSDVELALTVAAGSGDPSVPADEGSFPVLATITLALGGGALIAGGVTGVLTLSKASDIKNNCVETVCPAAEEDAADDAKLLGNVSTAMFVIGGVLAATGIVLLIVDPFDDPSPATGEAAAEASASMGLRIGPTGAALVGTF